MLRILCAPLLAATLALGQAAPVQADERTERLIAGAILLGIIGAAIHESRDDDPRVTVERVNPVTPLFPQGDHWQVVPDRNRALPADCLRRYNTLQGELRLFEGTCLEHRFAGYHQLPLSCGVTIQNHGRFTSGFRPRCLRDAGYRLAGR